MNSPTDLPTFDSQGDLFVVIETPKGSRNKFKFDPELGTYRLNSVLAEGMVFPYDFGFVPRTEADDGYGLERTSTRHHAAMKSVSAAMTAAFASAPPIVRRRQCGRP